MDCDVGAPYKLLFLGEIDEVTASRKSLWSNTLVLPDVDFVYIRRSTQWTEPFHCVGATYVVPSSYAPTCASALHERGPR